MIYTLCFPLEAIHTVSKASKSFDKKQNQHTTEQKFSGHQFHQLPQNGEKHRAEHRAELALEVSPPPTHETLT